MPGRNPLRMLQKLRYYFGRGGLRLVLQKLRGTPPEPDDF